MDPLDFLMIFHGGGSGGDDHQGGRPPKTTAAYLVGAVVALAIVWNLFLVDRVGLPAGYNFWITVGLISLCGIIAIAGVSMSLLESITLEQTHVRIRKGYGPATLYGYHEIAAITPDEDEVRVTFKDGRKMTVKNLRLGEGLQLRKLNSFLEEKAKEKSRPELSILEVKDDKKYLM